MTDAEQARTKLNQLATPNEQPLLRIQALFPFQLFPDVLVVDRKKVTVHQQTFFWNRKSHSFSLSDIMTTIVETSLFFATIKIVDRFYPQETIVVEYLSKRDAQQFRHIIDGLSIAIKEGVNVDLIPPDELLEKVRTLGRSHVLPDPRQTNEPPQV